ncbi:MAG: transglycosylase domain-containing protein, partial [Eubacteriales bacterium]|nr:transglycosylase domain-containing protein [Eubacteriales bacterium]
MNSEQDRFERLSQSGQENSSGNVMRRPNSGPLKPDDSSSDEKLQSPRDTKSSVDSRTRIARSSDSQPKPAIDRREAVHKQNSYRGDPVPGEHKRRYGKARREWRKRISGYPTKNRSFQTVPEVIWSAAKKGLKIALVLLLVLAIFIAGAGSGMLSGYISTTTPLELIDLKSSEGATVILDNRGQVVRELTGAQNVNREYVSITRMKPSYIDDAFIAIEDERFLDHKGIDPKRIANAVAGIFLNAGNPTHGASTITQQVVKMMSGADERSAQRKVQEWERALELERRLSKDEIMELFLNMVPMANNLTGVQAAAMTYFGKDVSELDLAECAFLAGIPNLPSIYNPKTEYGRRNAMRRMRIILSKMYELEMIEEDEYKEALNRELVFLVDEREEGEGVTSYFVDAVVEQVIEQLMQRRGYSYNLAQTAVFQHGLTIETTMDQEVQRKAEASFLKQELFSTNYEALPDIPEPPQGAITIVSNEPATRGEVVGLVGGFGQKNRSFIFNRATQAYRQPGSSIKPVLVYGPAIETGMITAASIFNDEPKFLDPQNPEDEWPVNVTRQHYGLVTARQSLQQSYNTIAVEIYTEVLNPPTGLSYLRRLGIDRTNEPHPSGALGAFGQGVTTTEMAGAYAAFANEGLYTEPILFRRVLDADGNVLLENKPQYDQVFSPGTATVMTSILEGTLMNTSWITPYAQLPNQTAAGKTGTTSDQIDVWFCGYTPYYTAAVWYGFDNANGRRTEIDDADSRNAIRIWQDVMAQLHEDKAPLEFEESGNIS